MQYPRLDNNQTLPQAITNQDQDEVQIIKDIKGNSKKANQSQCDVWHNDNNQIPSQSMTNQDQDEVQIIKEIKGNSRKTNQIQCEVWYNETYCGKIPSPQSSPTKTKPTNTETKSRPPKPISPSLTQPTFQFWNPHLYIKPKQTMSKQIGTRRNRSVSI